MNKRIYVISRCVAVKGEYYEFHFRGFYHGFRVEKVMINNFKFETDEDYLIDLSCLSINAKTLYGKCLKAKKIFN